MKKKEFYLLLGNLHTYYIINTNNREDEQQSAKDSIIEC